MNTKLILGTSSYCLVAGLLSCVSVLALLPDSALPAMLYIDPSTAKTLGFKTHDRGQSVAPSNIIRTEHHFAGIAFTGDVELKKLIDTYGNVDEGLQGGDADTVAVIGTKMALGDLWTGDESIDDNAVVILAKGAGAEKIIQAFAGLGESQNLAMTNLKNFFDGIGTRVVAPTAGTKADAETRLAETT